MATAKVLIGKTHNDTSNSYHGCIRLRNSAGNNEHLIETDATSGNISFKKGNVATAPTSKVSVSGIDTILENLTIGTDTDAKNLTVTGNLEVKGTVTTIDSTTVKLEDPLIELGRNNSGDSLDIGFYGKYNDGTDKYTGLFRDAGTGTYKLFTEASGPTDNVIDIDNSNYANLEIGDLNATGDIDCTAITTSSDSRLKTDIIDIENPLEIVKSLNGKMFNWKDKENPRGKSYGFIAQDIEKLLPSVVKKDSDDFGKMSINYDAIVPILSEAVKKLMLEVEELKSKLL
tara:strand:+ start:790 stop:1650 length:861 start_codon:yes stop_codon:yes gene_type:complete